MQVLEPTEKNMFYSSSGANAWISGSTNTAIPIADNIIALIVRAQDPASDPPDISDTYSYDTYDPANSSPGPTNTQKATSQQLPPVLQITMVAIEEASAQRMEQGSSEPNQIKTALAGKFSDPAQYDSDMKDLEQSLIDAGIRYQIYSGAVPLLEAKWTK